MHKTDNQTADKTPMPPQAQHHVEQPYAQSQTTVPRPSVSEHMQDVMASAPRVIKIKLAKKNNGLGLSIVAARGSNQMTGIYIKSVVAGGAASDDGRLAAGDQLLAVDDQSLINVTQERAAELMCKSGPCVVLTVAKDAATYHNLDALLNKSPQPQPMPVPNALSQPHLAMMQQAQTLPRAHHQPAAEHASINLPLQSTQLTPGIVLDQHQHQLPFKTRSMSQDLTRASHVSRYTDHSNPTQSDLVSLISST